jgi:hypothetical protein
MIFISRRFNDSERFGLFDLADIVLVFSAPQDKNSQRISVKKSLHFQPAYCLQHGFDAGKFVRNGTRLPEGLSRFSVEVYEYTRPGKAINRPQFSTLWISLGNPPLLSLPRPSLSMSPLRAGFKKLRGLGWRRWPFCRRRLCPDTGL